MPIGSNLWGGRIGQARRMPTRQMIYPSSHRANAIWRDQAQFFNGGPMTPGMTDRWAPHLGSYGPYEGRQRRRHPPDFTQMLW